MTAKKLSTTMLRTIDAIRAGGGEVHPELGGWWRSSPDGPRLEIVTDDWREKDVVGTTTIMSLHERGVLVKIGGQGNRNHSAYRLAEQQPSGES